MKILITILCLLLFGCSKPQTDNLYIIAQSGLYLRDKPSMNSRQIILIPYGSLISVANINDKSSPVELENIKAYWVHVKYNNYTGYTFSGYLYKYIPPKIGIGSFKKYLDANFTKVGPRNKIIVNDCSCVSRETRYEQLYSNGYKLVETDLYESHYEAIESKDLKIHEAFLLAKYCYEPLFNNLNPSHIKLNTILSSQNDEYHFMVIEEKGNIVSVQYHTGV